MSILTVLGVGAGLLFGALLLIGGRVLEKLLTDEIAACLPLATACLVCAAARRLPEEWRTRYQEEWLAEAAAYGDRRISGLIYALRIGVSAQSLAKVLAVEPSAVTSPKIVAGLPGGVIRDYPLARLTTIRTGGHAEFFASVGSLEQLEGLVAWSAAEGIEIGVVGSGSNLLIADSGVRGLIVKLSEELSSIEIDGTRIICGGGARLPAASACAARAGLAGLEFGVNIPGSVGGAVRLNASAFGGELGQVLEWVDVVGPDGTARRAPSQLGFAYHRSALVPGEIVARASFVLADAGSAEVRATLADMRSRRRAALPSGDRTFGSAFKNPHDPRAAGRTAGQLLQAVGCGGLRFGDAGFSGQHANFVVNHGEATTADVVAVMAEGRRRVKEAFGVELEPEVQALGAVVLPEEWRSR